MPRSHAGAARRFTAATTALTLVLLGAGCSVLVQPDETRLRPGSGDGGGDGSIRPDGVSPDVPTDGPSPCPAGCDDGVACTVDRCDATARRCVHTADNSLCPMGMLCDERAGCGVRPCAGDSACNDGNVCNGAEACTGGRCVAGTPMRCDDGQMCNGTETCDPMMGCRPGTPPSCDDADPCTQDRCNPSGAGACEHVGTDADRDGYYAAPSAGVTCARGTDCDDANAAVHPGATEVCNGRDDNCNGMADEGLMCAPMNDTCDRAVPLTLAGPGVLTQSGTTIGMHSEIDSSCGDRGGPDVWYQLSYPSNTDLEVSVVTSGAAGSPTMRPDSVVHIRTACSGGSELVCNDDVGMSSLNSRVWIRGEPGALDARRTIYIVVDAVRPGAESAFTLTVTATAAQPLSMCGGALFDVTSGGTLLGNVPRRMSFARGFCTPGTISGAEDVVVYNGPVGTLQLSAYATAFRPILFSRRDCTMGPDLACDAGLPARITTTGPGPLYLFVDGAGAGGVPYLLQVYRP